MTQPTEAKKTKKVRGLISKDILTKYNIDVIDESTIKSNLNPGQKRFSAIGLYRIWRKPSDGPSTLSYLMKIGIVYTENNGAGIDLQLWMGKSQGWVNIHSMESLYEKRPIKEYKNSWFQDDSRRALGLLDQIIDEL